MTPARPARPPVEVAFAHVEPVGQLGSDTPREVVERPGRWIPRGKHGRRPPLEVALGVSLDRAQQVRRVDAAVRADDDHQADGPGLVVGQPADRRRSPATAAPAATRPPTTATNRSPGRNASSRAESVASHRSASAGGLVVGTGRQLDERIGDRLPTRSRRRPRDDQRDARFDEQPEKGRELGIERTALGPGHAGTWRRS